jgi:hypothetical protein
MEKSKENEKLPHTEDLLKTGEPRRDLVREILGDTRISPEENERWFQERGGAKVTVTFVKLDPKTGRPPTLTIVEG